MDYPEFVIDVDRAKAADLGLTQGDIMKSVIAAFNSSIQFNKRNFWIDPIGGNQCIACVHYPENDIKSIETLLNIPTAVAVTKKRRSHSPTGSSSDGRRS